MIIPHILLPGGTGLLGSLLAQHLARRGHPVIILSRNPQPHAHPLIRVCHWTPTRPGPWQHHVDHAAAVISLAGKSVNCRYTRRNQEQILDSRILPTQLLGEAIARSPAPPPLWLNMSTATIYKHAFTPQDELTGAIGPTPEIHDAFSIHVATQWEHALFSSDTPHTRKLALRTAMVLALGKNSVYPILRRLARLGLAGPIAGGAQYVSWILDLDFLRAIDFVLAQPGNGPALEGPFNLASPNPLPFSEFLRALRHSSPTILSKLAIPTPKPLLQLACLLLRTEPELLLKSRHVLPTRLLNSGYHFLHPTLATAFADLEARFQARHSPRYTHLPV